VHFHLFRFVLAYSLFVHDSFIDHRIFFFVHSFRLPLTTRREAFCISTSTGRRLSVVRPILCLMGRPNHTRAFDVRLVLARGSSRKNPRHPLPPWYNGSPWCTRLVSTVRLPYYHVHWVSNGHRVSKSTFLAQ